MVVQHFLTTRWRSGYFAVSQVTPRVTVMLEEIRRPFEQSVDDASRIFITRIENLGTVGTLFGKVYLSTDRRRATFQHSVLVAESDAAEDQFLWLFRDLYGRTPDRTLYILCNLLSAREHWEGSPLVREILFGEEAPEAGSSTRVSRAGALVREVMDRWPESLRVLADVGVDELDLTTGRRHGPPTTDPAQPALSEISEEFTEEVTSTLTPALRSEAALGRGDLTPAASEGGGAAAREGDNQELAETRATTLLERDVPRELVDAGDGGQSDGPPPGALGPASESLPVERGSAWRWASCLVVALLFSTAFGLTYLVAPRPEPSPVRDPRAPPGDPPLGAQSSGTQEAAVQAEEPSEVPKDQAPSTAPTLAPVLEPARDTTPVASAPAVASCFRDGDGDGYGNAPADAARAARCSGRGWVRSGGDCDDSDRSVHPKAREWCDGLDNACSTVADDHLADFNKNNKPDCREGGEKWREVRLKDKSLWDTEYLKLEVAVEESGCERVRPQWRYSEGGKRTHQADLVVVDGAASCVVPWLTGEGVAIELDANHGAKCPDETFSDEEGGGTVTVVWLCCLERELPAGSRDTRYECEEISGSGKTLGKQR